MGPDQVLQPGWTSMVEGYQEKIKVVLQIALSYKSSNGSMKSGLFRIDFSELEGYGSLGRPHLYSIAQSLEKIQKDINHLARGFHKLKVHTFDHADRERERQELEATEKNDVSKFTRWGRPKYQSLISLNTSKINLLLTMTNLIPRSDEEVIIEHLRAELLKSETSRRRRIIEKFVLAALGSIPWIGGFLSAAADYQSQEGELRKDSLQTQWLEEHQGKLADLKQTLEEVNKRFEALGSTIDARIQSDEYLALVRKAFRAWDEADTNEKRLYAANIVTNAAGSRICSDDVIRLFLDATEKTRFNNYSHDGVSF